MQLSHSIKRFYDRFVTQDDRFILIFMFIGLSFGLLCLAANALIYQYPGNFYLPTFWLEMAPAVLIMLLFSMRVKDLAPRPAYVIRSYSLYFFIAIVEVVLMMGIQYTPFPTIDHHLAHMDQALGINTPAILDWTHNHEWFKKLMWFGYHSWVYQLMIIPLVLALLMDKEGVNIYLLGGLIGLVIGTMTYYFFPTAGPTLIFQSPYFETVQHATSLKFYQIHHYQVPTTYDGGMIAFPSFHVFGAILSTYACKNKKWLFYPLILLNTVLILATVFLGWHYLVDVFGSFLLLWISIYLLKLCYKRRLKYSASPLCNFLIQP